MAYEQELARIRAQYGGLEDIRQSLGLSRKEICGMLLVDPSAWTRWVKGANEAAPPHVYRTLELLCEHVRRNPSFLGDVARSPIQKVKWTEGTSNLTIEPNDEDKAEIKTKYESLKSEIHKKEELTLGWKFLSLINVIFMIYLLFFR